MPKRDKLIGDKADNCICPVCRRVHTDAIAYPQSRDHHDGLIYHVCTLCQMYLVAYGRQVHRLMLTLPTIRWTTTGRSPPQQ